MSYPKQNIFVNLSGDARLQEIMSKLFRNDTWKSCVSSTDSETYKKLQIWQAGFVDKLPQKTIDTWRSKSRVKEFRQLFDIAEVKPQNLDYLDFGSGTSVLSSAIGAAFRMHTFATDIECWHGDERISSFDNVTFEYLKNGKIPFDKKFNIVSCLMVLHHIQDVDSVILDIKSHMHKNGLLILREHDTTSDDENNLVHIEHALHSCVLGTNTFETFEQEYIGNYNTTLVWIKKFKSHGFRLIATTSPIDVNRYQYLIFKI